MKIVSTIEARMTSSRLPGKVLMPAAGKPMLQHLVERLKAVPAIDEIVIATTVNQDDDPIIDLAKQLNVGAYRGSEEDVMQRVIDAGASADAEIMVEITGDCPLIDPEVVQHSIDVFLNNKVDYVSTQDYPVGMDTQVFRWESLKKSGDMTDRPLDREHVSLHMIENPELFSQMYLVPPRSLWRPEIEVTLDEQADYDLIRRIIEHADFKNRIPKLIEIIELLDKNPEWTELNAHVHRKGAT